MPMKSLNRKLVPTLGKLRLTFLIERKQLVYLKVPYIVKAL